MASTTSVNKWASWGLIGLVLFTWWPALFHVFRGDHLCLLIEIPWDQGFSETWSHLISYNRTRTCYPSDPILYRPVLFTLISVEFATLGRDPFFWQLFGLCLYTATCVLLWRILRVHLSPALALAVAALFAVNASHIDAVSWQHIHAYVLFALLSFAFVLTPSTNKGRWVQLVIALLMSMTYELGGALFAVWAIWKMRREGQRRWELLLPLPIYIVANFVDAQLRQVTLGDGQIERGSIYESIKALPVLWAQLSGWWIWPTSLIDPQALRSKFPVADFRLWIGGAISLLGAIWLYRKRRALTSPQRDLLQFGLWGALGFVAIVALGRMAPRGLEYIAKNTYYAFQFSSFAIFILAVALSRLSLRSQGRAAYLLGALALTHLIVSQNTATAMMEAQWPAGQLQRATSRWIRENPERAQGGLSYCNPPSGNLPFVDLKPLQHSENEIIDFPRLIYGRAHFAEPVRVAYCASSKFVTCESCQVESCCAEEGESP